MKALTLAEQLEVVYAELGRHGWDPIHPRLPPNAPDSVLRARLLEEEDRLRALGERRP